MMYKPWKRLTPFLYFVKPYPLHIFGLILLILAASLMEGFNIFALFGLLNMILPGVSSSVGISGGKITSYFMNVVNLLPYSNKFIAVMVIFFVLTLIKCFFDFFRRYYTCFVSAKIWHDVQYEVFKKCLYADYQFFLDSKEGEILYKGFTAPSTIGITLQYSCEFIAELVKLAVILAVLIVISPKLSVIIVIFSGFFYLFTHFIAQKITYYLGIGRRDTSILQTVILAELINGIKQIKVFLSEKRWLKDYDNAMKSYFNYYVKDESWQYLPPSILELLAIGVLSLVFILMGVGKEGISKGYFSVFAVYVYSLYRFMPSLKNLSAKKMSYAGNLSIVESLYNFCKQDISNIADGDLNLQNFKDSIEFKNVNFEYPGRKTIFKDLNLTIKKGETTAIVGKSGSGKTTLVNLILKLFVPKDGKIFIDGIDLMELKLDTWLGRIGYVSQETFIFNGSIKENIIFGRVEDEKVLMEAVKMANIEDFISGLPEKYETRVGDKGLKLSGGQRQRLAIARAMYGGPEILIFDEATSSLDNLSEGLIQNSIRHISFNHTVILVAHRLSTVIDSDKIIVLDSGCIIEQGTHGDLMNNGNAYWRLYNKEALI